MGPHFTVDNGEIFCIVKFASAARDFQFVTLIILISHPDSVVLLQWVVVNVTLRWSSIGVLSNVQFSWALFRYRIMHKLEVLLKIMTERVARGHYF